MNKHAYTFETRLEDVEEVHQQVWVLLKIELKRTVVHLESGRKQALGGWIDSQIKVEFKCTEVHLEGAGKQVVCVCGGGEIDSCRV